MTARALDPHRIRRLLEKHDWRTVTKMLQRPDGSMPTKLSLYNCMYRAGLSMRKDGVDAVRKAYWSTRNTNATNPNVNIDCGIWMPAPPKPLAVIPDYRTNTVRAAVLEEVS